MGGVCQIPIYMLLKTVFVRFYKSFNYDYLRKHHHAAKPLPWELLNGAFYPYVRVPVDARVTTVVGANESGKSHLLSAIEKGISGADIESADFCRYSRFFGVIKGEVRCPDFGIEWTELSDKEIATVRKLCGATSPRAFDSFLLFRTHDEGCRIFLPDGADFSPHSIDEAGIETLKQMLPRAFRIDARIALPASVGIRDLAPQALGGVTEYGSSLSRRSRFDVFGALDGLVGHLEWFKTPQALQGAVNQVQPALLPVARLLSHSEEPMEREAQQRRAAEVKLARDLICKVAHIDELALKQLYEALREGREGHVNGLIERINAALAARLNFPRFWVQDRDFALMVSPREHDLVFTIRDRTGTQYSFDERSSGLKYFLSYYIQYLAHEHDGPDTEILLMDEPDAYLSSQAQQDLLKVFQAFAFPDGERRRVQVIYVTHSPFLIDKNHADRIRVLEKGVGDEGTRVVRDAARNHYEPLRSAFGAFVGETAFIGHCNLMVEGLGDQILLAGAATWLRNGGVPELETLDLNQLTIVPAGGAPQVPYLVYLARGRDLEQPAVIVLLDSDASGNEARQALKRGAPRGRQILSDSFVVQLGELSDLHTAPTGAAREIEDLVPLDLAAAALQQYAREFWRADAALVKAITSEALRAFVTPERSLFDSIAAWAAQFGEGFSVNKVGFSRTVVDVLQAHEDQSAPFAREFAHNFRILFRRLRELQRKADRERSAERVTQKIERLKKSFIQDYPDGVSRERASIMLEDMEDALDDSQEADSIRSALKPLARAFRLHEDVLQPVPDYASFQAELDKLRYVPQLAAQPAKNGHAEHDSPKGMPAKLQASNGAVSQPALNQAAPVPQPATPAPEMSAAN